MSNDYQGVFPYAEIRSEQQTAIDFAVDAFNNQDKRDLEEKMRIVKLMSKEKNSKIKKLKPDKEKHYHCDTIYEHED